MSVFATRGGGRGGRLGEGTGPRMRVDVAAAGRFIRHAIKVAQTENAAEMAARRGGTSEGMEMEAAPEPIVRRSLRIMSKSQDEVDVPEVTSMESNTRTPKPSSQPKAPPRASAKHAAQAKPRATVASSVRAAAPAASITASASSSARGRALTKHSAIKQQQHAKKPPARTSSLLRIPPSTIAMPAPPPIAAAPVFVSDVSPSSLPSIALPQFTPTAPAVLKPQLPLFPLSLLAPTPASAPAPALAVPPSLQLQAQPQVPAFGYPAHVPLPQVEPPSQQPLPSMVTPPAPIPVPMSLVIPPAPPPEPEPIRLTLHVFLPPSFVLPALLESAAQGSGGT